MFEVNNSRKITKNDSLKKDNIQQQRTFLNQPQDSLELSTYKPKKAVSFKAAIHNAVKTFLCNNTISPKAVNILALNNLIEEDFQPETHIYIDDYNKFTDMPVVFQRKLAIDMYKGSPNQTLMENNGVNSTQIIFNTEGKPEIIGYYEKDKLKHSEEFEYAHKQDGSPVLIKQKIYAHNNDDKILANEITFYKHHNGAVTISSTDGRQMSYSLRKETIRHYNNIQPAQVIEDKKTTDTPKQVLNTQQEIEQKFTPFIKPTPSYPTKEWSYAENRIINKKFEGIKQEFEKFNKPNTEDAFCSHDTIIEDLEQVKKLVLEVKDPIIQKAILKKLSQMKDSDLDTQYVGSYNRINFHSYAKEFGTVYNLARLSALLDKDAFGIDKNNRFDSNLNKKFVYTGYKSDEEFSADELENINCTLESIKSNNLISDSEKDSEIQKEIHKVFISHLGTNINLLDNELGLKKYLSDTYLKPNLQPELREDLEKVEQACGEIIIPMRYSNFTPESLENFNKLSDIAKKHFLKHPNMLKSIYLYNENRFQVDTPYTVLAGLSEDEWNIFENRNISNILDIVTGYNINSFKEKTGSNIHTVLEMSDTEWNKLNDFNLLNLGKTGDELSFERNRNLTFNFDEMKNIVDSMSYKEWEIANKRGLINLKSGCNEYTNYGRNIGVPIFIALSKVPDSTFNYLKKIELFNDKELITTNTSYDSITDIAKGIEFLSTSHNNVYENVTTLYNNGFSADLALETVGTCATKYNKFGKYLTQKSIELKNKLPNDSYNHFVPKLLPMFIDLQSVKNKSNINELSIEEKRTLLKNLIKYNAQLFEHASLNLFDSEIIPKNKEEYCTLLPKLIKSIGIDTRPVTEETITSFNNAINTMSGKSSEFMNTKFTKDFHIDLDYSRKQFISDIQDKLSKLSGTEKMKVYDYYGFDLTTDKNGTIQMHGYPINLNNGIKLAEIEDESTKQVIEEIRPIVERFSTNNNVTIEGKPELTKQINSILTLFPEFRSIIGKEQHDTQDFTVDVHTLKVLQGVMSDTKYEKLSEHDKQIINIATILHDITKAEKLVDKTHAAYSAYDAYHLLAKMNMPEKDKQQIYQIIKNHEWLAEYNSKIKIGIHEYREKTPTEKDKSAKDIAFELKDGNNFELSNMLTKADMKAVKETDAFFNKYAAAFNEATSRIKPFVDNIQKTAIHLPQTKIPKASELIIDGENVKEYITKDKNGNQIKNKIVYLKPNMDLGKLGFEKGLNSDDFNVIVHALDKDSQSATFQALGNIDSDSLLSSSYITYKKGNYHVFRPQGFILDVNSNDIQAGTYKDFGSGYGKDLDTLKSEYLFNGSRKSIRNFMSDQLKRKMKLSDGEYKRLYPEIADKSITDLDKSHPKVANAMREIFMEMEVHKRKYGRDYNEWLVSRPKIQGVFIEGSEYKYGKDVPEFLAKYAAENDLPIIYFGE